MLLLLGSQTLDICVMQYQSTMHSYIHMFAQLVQIIHLGSVCIRNHPTPMGFSDSRVMHTEGVLLSVSIEDH